jgi:SAM-dependent methyltransferase
MTGFVGAQHEFHDAAFVQGWADRFVPTQPRIALFNLIMENIDGLPNSHVVELGLGPGYMARHILERNAMISYEGVDFSDAFFARLSAFHAARHRVSTNRFSRVTGISMLSELNRDMEKLGGDHKTRRTAAIASLKVGWCLLYQAA